MQHGNIVYVVDSDEAIGEALAALLGTYDIDVQAFPDAESFLRERTLWDNGHGCLITEANLPGLNGLSLLRKLRAQGSSLPVIVLTNTHNRDVERQALEFGATDVIDKPFINTFLSERLSELLPGAPNLPSAANNVAVRNDTMVTFRMMRPDDAEIEQEFVRGLSASSKHLRFFSGMAELGPALLYQFTHPSYPGNYALVATVSNGGREQQIGVARYAVTAVEGIAEFAVVVADQWQGFGIASRLIHGLTAAAAIAGVERLEGLVLKENQRMLNLAAELGFITSSDGDDPSLVRVGKDLRNPTERQEPASALVAGRNTGDPPQRT